VNEKAGLKRCIIIVSGLLISLILLAALTYTAGRGPSPFEFYFVTALEGMIAAVSAAVVLRLEKGSERAVAPSTIGGGGEPLQSLSAWSTHFEWLGSLVIRIHPRLGEDLTKAGIPVYPVAYASLLGLLAILTTASSLLFVFFGYGFLGAYSLLALVSPLFIVGFGLVYPRMVAINRSSRLEAEVPFVSAYLAMMATGGVSPYRSMGRLREFQLLPGMASVAASVVTQVELRGLDAVTAIEQTASGVPSREYRDLVSGYVTTLRTGGDVIHYLQSASKSIYQRAGAKIRLMTDRITLIMEIYVAVVVLLGLGLYTLFSISALLPAGLASFSPSTFTAFAYLLLPFLSVVFLYLLDVVQTRPPVSEWRQYRVFGLVSLPLLLGMTALFVIPFYLSTYPPIMGFGRELMAFLTERLNMPRGFEPAVGLYFAISISSAPMVVAHRLYTTEAGAVFSGMVRFFRDLVEVRKTGLSPERCISLLAKRDYGRFTRHLKTMCNQMLWGVPPRKVVETLKERVRDWYSLINAHLLMEAINVGGGGTETLETLASFAEDMDSLERQKRYALRPLLLIPYVSGLVFLVSILFLVSFMGSASTGSSAVEISEFIRFFVPPLLLQMALSGLVAGKVSEGRLSGGFKHVFILSILSMIAMRTVPRMGTFLFQALR
jgi:flagellar protein FlaJ